MIDAPVLSRDAERGIGHASRFVAVRAALRELGWRSLFLVERPQQLIADYGFEQVSVSHYDDSLVGEAPAGVADPSGRFARLAARIVEGCVEPDDLVLHDVVVYRPLYDWAGGLGRPQAYISRARKDRGDPVEWVRQTAPGITKVFPLGSKGSRT